MEQPLSPDIDQLLQDLQPEQSFNAARISAAKRLGKLSASDLRVVKALIAATESDTSPNVRKAAAEALQAPAHQEILQRHPDLMAKVQGHIAAQSRSATLAAGQPVADETADSLTPTLPPEIEWGRSADVSPVPVTGWRLALAAVYGLVTALVLGYLWYLLATNTSTRYGYAALALGLAVGVVVNFVAGDSKDQRYAALGAVLAGVGIAFGEFLIFGLPESRFVYEFSVVDIVIYAIGVYEGWIMPQRSIAFVQERRHTINEDNWKSIFGVGVAVLVLVLGFSGLSMFIGTDLPDLSAAVLTSRDFPHDFLEPSPEAFGVEVGESIEAGLKVESAFVLLSSEPLEMILGFTMLIPNKQDQADFDRTMRQGDALLEDWIQGLGGRFGFSSRATRTVRSQSGR